MCSVFASSCGALNGILRVKQKGHQAGGKIPLIHAVYYAFWWAERATKLIRHRLQDVQSIPATHVMETIIDELF